MTSEVLPKHPDNSIARGMMIAFAVQIGLILVTLPLMLYTGFGVFQWIIQLPLFVIFWRRGQKRTAKGILLTGLIGILINALCALLLVWKMSPP